MRVNSKDDRKSADKPDHQTTGVRNNARVTRYRSGNARDAVSGASGDGSTWLRSFSNCALDKFEIAADKAAAR